VTIPDAGGIPDAIAMPMHRGSATRNTTQDARKSLAKGLCVISYLYAEIPVTRSPMTSA
jgi:hypothetical protein